MAGSTDEQLRLRGRSHAETRSAVLDLIRSAGQISRSEIARRSGLTEKTISGIVRSLLDAGLVVEAGYARSTGGKRAILIQLNDRELYAVGLSLDPGRCLLVVCGLDGSEVARSELRGTGTDQPAAVLTRLSSAMKRLLRRGGVDRSAVIGLCVALGGRRGAPEGWDGTAAVADLWEPFDTENELARLTGLPVTEENDANCAALGQYWATGTAARDFVTIYLAHGIGAGIVVAGSLYRGSSGNAGEIGHTLADPEGPDCWCGRHGCLDTVASPRAITEQVRADARLRRALGVTTTTPFADVYGAFVAAVGNDQPGAVAVFTAAANHLGDAVVNLVNTLDLDLVTLAGPGFGPLIEAYREVIDRKLHEVAFLRDVHPVTVRAGTGTADAAALGAASVVLHRRLTPQRAPR